MGEVDYVIVDPRSMRVTDIVVTTGVIGREIVVPVDVVESAVKDKVYLSVDEDHFGEFPDFIEVGYEEPPSGWRAPSGIFTRRPTSSGPLGRSGVSIRRRVLGPSTTDRTSSHVMDIRSALSTPSTLRSGVVGVTAFIVRTGHILKHDLAFPVGDIKDIRGGKISLRLTRDQAEQVRQLEEDSKS